MLLPILAVAMLVAAAGYAYSQYPEKFGGLLELFAKPAASPAVMPAPAPATVPQSSLPVATKPSAPLAPNSRATQPTLPDKTSVDSRSAGAKGKDSAPESGSSASSKKSAHSPAANPASKPKDNAAAKPAPQPIVMKSQPSESDPAVPLPSPLGIAPVASDGPLPALIANDAGTHQPVLQAFSVSQGVSKGLLLKTVQPAYPQLALQRRVEGTVDLMATISARGDVVGIRVVSGVPLLADAVKDAVQRWKYKPYTVNGAPVEFTTKITVNFRLPR